MVGEVGIELLESESEEVLDVLTEAFLEGNPLIPSLGLKRRAIGLRPVKVHLHFNQGSGLEDSKDA